VIEERELTRLLQQLGDRTTPSPPPLRRIVDEGEALRGRRSGRVRVFAVSAAAAALLGGGAVAATVIELPSGGNDSASTAGEAADGAGGGDAGADTAEEGAAAPVAPVGVSPDVADPGTVVRLDVPTDVAFGPEWTLEREVEGAWRSQFVLVDADFAAENGVVLSRPSGAVADGVDLRVTHRDPVPVVIPDAAVPGTYRICQPGDDGTQWCGELTVIR